MTPHFIEVHDGGEPLSICLEAIEWFNPDGIAMNHFSELLEIDETYDELKALISHAGCAIAKADPRLDTSHWISWDDLTKVEMIGEPVFNSNTRKWMLVLDSAGPYTHDWIVLLNDAGGQEKWIENDVKARPLYRMKATGGVIHFDRKERTENERTEVRES